MIICIVYFNLKFNYYFDNYKNVIYLLALVN